MKTPSFDVTATLTYHGRTMITATRRTTEEKLADVVAELGYIMRPLFAEQSLTLDVAALKSPSYQTVLSANGARGVNHGA